MEQLLEWMEIIEDVRQHRKVRHSVKDILIIVLFRKFDSLPPSSTQMQFHFIPYFSWFSSFLFCQIFEIFL